MLWEKLMWLMYISYNTLKNTRIVYAQFKITKNKKKQKKYVFYLLQVILKEIRIGYKI